MGKISLDFSLDARFVIALLVSLVFASPVPVAAQQQDSVETRKEELREEREEKADHLRPPDQPGRFERLLNRVEERLTGGGGGAMGFVGFRPKLGGLKPGAGISGGVLYSPFEPQGPTMLRAELLASLKRYWGVGLSGSYRVGPITFLGYGRYRHMPREDFYGYGGDSALDDQSNFRLNEAVGGVLVGLRTSQMITVGLRSSYIASSPGPGKDENYPNTTTWAAPGTIPSLEENARHAAFGGWLELDARNPKPAKRAYKYLTPTEPDVIGMPLASDRGVYVLTDLVHYASANDSRFSFTRFTLQSQQYVPFRHGRNVFAFREYLALTSSEGRHVPIYMLPSLGGAYTLRGFEMYRFREQHALLLNAEYRWQVWLFVDLALFYDAGQVFSSVDNISLDELHSSYGAGVRLRADDRGLARIDVARSVEGTQIHIRLSGYF